MKISKVFTQQPETIENQNIFDIKSVTTVHPKSPHKLSNNINQAITPLVLYIENSAELMSGPQNVRYFRFSKK